MSAGAELSSAPLEGGEFGLTAVLEQKTGIGVTTSSLVHSVGIRGFDATTHVEIGRKKKLYQNRPKRLSKSPRNRELPRRAWMRVFVHNVEKHTPDKAR